MTGLVRRKGVLRGGLAHKGRLCAADAGERVLAARASAHVRGTCARPRGGAGRARVKFSRVGVCARGGRGVWVVEPVLLRARRHGRVSAGMAKRSEARGERSEAWATLASRLERLARALVGRGREADATDLTQTTIAKLLARGVVPGGDSSSGVREPPPYHYARSVLVRVYLDERRSARRRVARAARWAWSRGVEEAGGSGEGAETTRAIEGALEGLTGLQRAAVTLRVVEELSYEGIAEALGTTAPRVRSALHAARGKLRETLGAEWRDEE